MGAGSQVKCPNGHGTVELVATKVMAGCATYHELSCGCRNTGPDIQAGVSVSGTTSQVGKPIKGWPPREANT